MPVIALGGLTAGGGRIIGPKIAKKLNIDYVDKDILKQTALQSGLDIELFTKKEEAPTTIAQTFVGKISKISFNENKKLYINHTIYSIIIKNNTI